MNISPKNVACFSALLLFSITVKAESSTMTALQNWLQGLLHPQSLSIQSKAMGDLIIPMHGGLTDLLPQLKELIPQDREVVDAIKAQKEQRREIKRPQSRFDLFSSDYHKGIRPEKNSYDEEVSPQVKKMRDERLKASGFSVRENDPFTEEKARFFNENEAEILSDVIDPAQQSAYVELHKTSGDQSESEQPYEMAKSNVQGVNEIPFSKPVIIKEKVLWDQNKGTSGKPSGELSDQLTKTRDILEKSPTMKALGKRVLEQHAFKEKFSTVSIAEGLHSEYVAISSENGLHTLFVKTNKENRPRPTWQLYDALSSESDFSGVTKQINKSLSIIETSKISLTVDYAVKDEKTIVEWRLNAGQNSRYFARSRIILDSPFNGEEGSTKEVIENPSSQNGLIVFSVPVRNFPDVADEKDDPPPYSLLAQETEPTSEEPDLNPAFMPDYPGATAPYPSLSGDQPQGQNQYFLSDNRVECHALTTPTGTADKIICQMRGTIDQQQQQICSLEFQLEEQAQINCQMKQDIEALKVALQHITDNLHTGSVQMGSPSGGGLDSSQLDSLGSAIAQQTQLLSRPLYPALPPSDTDRRRLEQLEQKMKTAEHQLQAQGMQLHELTGSTRFPTPRGNKDVFEMKSDIEHLKLGLSAVNSRQDILAVKTVNGILWWRIPDFKRRMREAKDRTALSLFSAPFYTSPHGYQMCIRAYLNGDGTGRDEYISVFLVLMKSQHDDLLPWPFMRRVTFELMNFNPDGEEVTETFQPDAASSSFMKPKKAMNIASGFPKFVKQSKVSEHSGFVKGDAITIRVKVDNSGRRNE